MPVPSASPGSTFTTVDMGVTPSHSPWMRLSLSASLCGTANEPGGMSANSTHCPPGITANLKEHPTSPLTARVVQTVYLKKTAMCIPETIARLYRLKGSSTFTVLLLNKDSRYSLKPVKALDAACDLKNSAHLRENMRAFALLSMSSSPISFRTSDSVFTRCSVDMW